MTATRVAEMTPAGTLGAMASTEAAPMAATATAAPSPAAAAATPTGQLAHQAPWYSLSRGTRFGVGLDVGAPAGAGLVGIFRPWWWLRTNAGLAYDYLGFGIRGGVSLVPCHWAVTPSLNLDVGHFFSGDASKFASNPTPTEKSLLNQATFTYVSPQLGLEFGSQRRFTFYLRGGLSYITGLSFAGKDVTAEAQSKITTSGGGSFQSAGDLSVRALIPSFSLGFNLFVD